MFQVVVMVVRMMMVMTLNYGSIRLAIVCGNKGLSDVQREKILDALCFECM